ncbi:MAG: hypothetical protein H7240_03965 [Glaciimonas sp.]|nr:hypothetical protein [Glaciimonas sp.]
MNKLIAALIATTFAMGSAFAQTATTPAKPVVATTTAAPAANSKVSSTTPPAAAASASSVVGVKSTPKSAASAMAEAPGGGAGKVWVNTKSNTYHCQGTEFYGKTKVGEYMTEADAKTKGAHANHGKACK